MRNKPIIPFSGEFNENDLTHKQKRLLNKHLRLAKGEQVSNGREAKEELRKPDQIVKYKKKMARKKAKEDKAAADDEFDQVMRLKQNMEEMQSDDSDDNRDGNDSDDDDEKKQKKAKKQEKDELKLSKKSKAIKKKDRHRSDDADFIKNLARIASKKKEEKLVKDAELGVPDITPKVAFNKSTMRHIQ